MFRVPENTVLRRAAAATLLVLASSLAACGSKDDDTANVPTATTPAAPAEPVSSTPVEESSVTDTKEGKAAIAKASDKEQSTASINSKIEAIDKALSGAGYKPSVSKAKASSTGSVQVDQIAIVFYRSAKEAAQAADQFAKVIAQNGGHGRLARTNERLYLMNIPGNATAENKAELAKVRKLSDDSL